MIRDKDFKNKVALSASRCETHKKCSALYAAKYIHKLPDNGNSGSRKGAVVHDTLETLHNARHHPKIHQAIKDGTCKTNPVLWKYVRAHAKKNLVDNEEDLDMIDSFLITALNTDFFGPLDVVETYSEKDFDFEVDDVTRGVSYRLKGFIDRSFIYRRGNNLYLKTIDWKTSKQKYRGDEITNNIQAIFYSLAIKNYLFPKIELKSFDFIFVKFKKEPVVSFPLKDNDFLSGYEIYLTEIQKQLNEFTEENANDNLAALNPANKWLCGKEGLKKDGTPNFICSCRKPLVYKVAIKDGKIAKSCFMEDNLTLEEGEELDFRYYTGCQFYYDRDGNKRQLSFGD